MKKILLSFGLCLAVTAGYAQSKEAKKEIRKYYTEKQIKYIQNRLKLYVNDCDDFIKLSNTLSDDFFDDDKKALYYYEYFLEPIEKELCTKGDILGFWNNINHLVEGE
ncbi:hypothetical protein [Ornithobacterium rhinotracheale]|uniref:hypothetical protein n=1 Tax=Ornithobacterium rhinotracheale TaxID=28251 RepID=UPI001FF3FEDF|nr:hypothetical protein [Ornithobacterium rhinotracheale]MCK0205901.1 hypothetical protein [Ornithobacterium rhinotracheale]